MECVNAIIVTTLNEKNPVSVWDLCTGTLIAHYRGGGSIPHHCMSIGKSYIFASERGKPLIHSWPLNRQHSTSHRLVASGKIECFDFSPDSVHVAVAISEKLHLYQLTSGRLLGVVSKHYQPISVVKFNTTGSLVTCGGQDGMITVWTLTNLLQKTDPIFSSMDHNLPIADLLFTSGSLRSRIISISADFTCKIFDVGTSQQLLSIAFPARPSCLALTPSETTIFIGNSEGGIFEVNLIEKSRKMAEYHQTTEENTSTFVGHEKQVSCLASSKDSLYLISGSHDETVRVWHIESHQCVRKISQKAIVTNLAFKVISAFHFTTDFKASGVINTFINPSNEDIQSGGFDILISDNRLISKIQQDLPLNGGLLMQDKVLVNCSPSDQEAHLKLEIEKLKTINNQMYEFSVKAILNSCSGVGYDSVVPHCRVKHNKITAVPPTKKPYEEAKLKKRSKWKKKQTPTKKEILKQKLLETNGNQFKVEMLSEDIN